MQECDDYQYTYHQQHPPHPLFETLPAATVALSLRSCRPSLPIACDFRPIPTFPTPLALGPIAPTRWFVPLPVAVLRCPETGVALAQVSELRLPHDLCERQ